MSLSNINLQNIQKSSPEPIHHSTKQSGIPATTSFKEMLSSRLEAPVQFSKHAALRLSDRKIKITGEQLQRVEDGIGRAEAKGIRDSLVLVDDLALVVNVKSRVVITALQSTQDNVFSNIDGAVIV